MPSHPRLISRSGYYHLMSRGNNKKKIFDSETDKARMLKFLRRIADSQEISILAYCIMPNHYHLLVYDHVHDTGQDHPEPPEPPNLKEPTDPPEMNGTGDGSKNPFISGSLGSVSHAMQRLNTAYAHSYAKRHEHVGHVFQGRFRSKQIDSLDYLCRVVRYIHQNPVKGGIVETAADYKFSSFGEYTGRHRYRILAASGAELMQELGFSDLKQFQEYHLNQDAQSMRDDLALFEDEADQAELELAYAKERQAAMPPMNTLEPKERLAFAMQLMADTPSLSKRTIASIAKISRARLNNVRRPQT